MFTSLVTVQNHWANTSIHNKQCQCLVQRALPGCFIKYLFISRTHQKCLTIKHQFYTTVIRTFVYNIRSIYMMFCLFIHSGPMLLQGARDNPRERRREERTSNVSTSSPPFPGSTLLPILDHVTKHCVILQHVIDM